MPETTTLYRFGMRSRDKKSHPKGLDIGRSDFRTRPKRHFSADLAALKGGIGCLVRQSEWSEWYIERVAPDPKIIRCTVETKCVLKANSYKRHKAFYI